jgi:hypothetical protein
MKDEETLHWCKRQRNPNFRPIGRIVHCLEITSIAISSNMCITHDVLLCTYVTVVMCHLVGNHCLCEIPYCLTKPIEN